MDWKTEHPHTPGLYLASVERRADSVRCWTGGHWTASVMVYDLHLPGRMPGIDWRKATPERGRTIEWLEAVTVDADGWISWGGIDSVPLRRNVPVMIRLRAGDIVGPLNPKGLRWSRSGEPADIVAYRPLDRLDASLPANDERLERRVTMADRRGVGHGATYRSVAQ